MKKLLILLLALMLSVGVSGAQSKSKLRKQQGIEQAAQILLSGQFKVMRLLDVNPSWWVYAAYTEKLQDLISSKNDSLNHVVSVEFKSEYERWPRRVILNTKTGSLRVEDVRGKSVDRLYIGTYSDVCSINDPTREFIHKFP